MKKVKYASTEISLAWAAEDVRLRGDVTKIKIEPSYKVTIDMGSRWDQKG